MLAAPGLLTFLTHRLRSSERCAAAPQNRAATEGARLISSLWLVTAHRPRSCAGHAQLVEDVVGHPRPHVVPVSRGYYLRRSNGFLVERRSENGSNRSQKAAKGTGTSF